MRGDQKKKFHKILEQICENLEGWSKHFQKMPFFAKFSHFWPKKFLGGQGEGFFRCGVKAKHPPPPPPGIMYGLTVFEIKKLLELTWIVP